MHSDNDHGALPNLELLFFIQYGRHEFTHICNHDLSHRPILVSRRSLYISKFFHYYLYPSPKFQPLDVGLCHYHKSQQAQYSRYLTHRCRFLNASFILSQFPGYLYPSPQFQPWMLDSVMMQSSMRSLFQISYTQMSILICTIILSQSINPSFMYLGIWSFLLLQI